ncbi:branched-chain amino acid aminotransferase 2, chloroplastic [Ziziphus jujuba]|uniref:Branched-chain-amino-acid aminotransferase n=1 Tax=Ziziphus jujuba TaxID=326968 RepID=A0A6P6GHK9_ZIZJJ|nr:branched-chain amino acid aminotransferase 2, chloroplastic [Ziziphus jujuba]
MYSMKCVKGDNFSQGNLIPFGNIELSPSAGVLNYGQGLFEGLKAYRKEDGHIQLFRPAENALRLKMGAERMCMPSPTVEQFIHAVKQTVLANKRWVPPTGKGALYLRPLLIGSGAILGLAPAPEYTFLVYASPVGNYHKGQEALDLLVEDKINRATRGGTGGVKSITNYAPVFLAQARAKAKGFADVIFLDSKSGKYIEEVSACNIFIVKGKVISTPAIEQGTVLPGVTRKSIMEIAITYGYKVEERRIRVKDLLRADEAFCTGTAVVVIPIGSVEYHGRSVIYKTGNETVCQALYETLVGIQTGRIEEEMGWTVEVC